MTVDKRSIGEGMEESRIGIEPERSVEIYRSQLRKEVDDRRLFELGDRLGGGIDEGEMFSN